MGVVSDITPDDRARFKIQCDRMLDLLRKGTATTDDLAAIARKYTSRITDLRKRGHKIKATRIRGGLFEYRLVG